MRERVTTTTYAVDRGCLLPLLVMTGAPAALLVCALIAQAIIYG